ncbi:hypothetical protein JNUCC0626_21025 [Lentzea sp. JNUCC 0626]|uniref:hypothetical protein n=1 Tax=Lentzea sp. JNUCC 0626 TaxID=3367513 RepID=UPI00374971E0
MTNNKAETNNGALMAFLVVAIGLVPVSSVVSAEWLRITILVVAILGISTVSFFLLRNVKRRQANGD